MTKTRISVRDRESNNEYNKITKSHIKISMQKKKLLLTNEICIEIKFWNVRFTYTPNCLRFKTQLVVY